MGTPCARMHFENSGATTIRDVAVLVGGAFAAGREQADRDRRCVKRERAAGTDSGPIRCAMRLAVKSISRSRAALSAVLQHEW